MTQPLEILMVEDNEGDVEMVRAALDDQLPPCKVSVVKDGREALNYLFQHGDFQNAAAPQLILLDLNMSGMDGKILLKILKGDERVNTIPVVVLTSSRAPSDIREAYAHHANCYVVKPFDSKDFKNAIRQVVDFWRDLAQLPHEATAL
jgi:two-component system, chemotaxis family, response regulator Rcp1